MSDMKPEVRHKTFTYRTGIRWLEGRAGELGSEGKQAFRVASPPEFKGEAGAWTPEDLFVAAVNACTMTTFAAYSQRKNLPIASYTCQAEGTLEFVEGAYRFTRVVLRPVVTVKDAEAVEETRKTLEDAHRGCMISNSIRGTVTMEAEVRPAS